MAQYHLHPLDDCREWTRRASKHIAEFKDMLEAARIQQANAVPLNFDPNPPHEWLLAVPPETLYGMQFSVVVGEICYNLRSALDYLVFHLAELDSRIQQEGTQFPIVDTRKLFQDRIATWMKGINSSHVAVLERLQPYNGCNWSKRLRDLSNPDKHRELVRHIGESRITVHLEEGKNLSGIHGVVRQATHPTRGVVDVKVHVALGVAFSDGSPVVQTIEEIQAGVAHTLADFNPSF